MASIERIPVVWNGGTGLPGVNVFYGTPSVPTLASGLYTFFDAIKALIPVGITVTVPGNGDMVDDVSGELSGVWSSTGVGTVTGTSSMEYAAGVGVAVQWNTNGVANRRRIRGRTFLAPLSRAAFQADGTLGPTAITTISGAAATLVDMDTLVVFSRPTTPTSNDGESNLVLSATVPDRITALRSRRY